MTETRNRCLLFGIAGVMAVVVWAIGDGAPVWAARAGWTAFALAWAGLVAAALVWKQWRWRMPVLAVSTVAIVMLAYTALPRLF